MQNLRFIIGLILGVVLIVEPLFGKRRADRFSRILTFYLGCAALIWAILGFLQFSSEQHRLVFQSYKNLVGGVAVGFGVALLTHLYVARSSSSTRKRNDNAP